MTNSVRLLLTLLLAAPAARAQGLPPFELDGIRALPGVQKVRFTTDDSGLRLLPTTPPNLTREQVRRVASVMSGGAPGIDKALVYRVVNVMAKADIASGEPVPAREWDRRIAAFEAGFNAAFPAGSSPSPADFERGVDELLRGLIARADDPHTEYLDRRAWERRREELLDGGFVGVGLQMLPDPAGLRVARPMSGSPAADAGLRKGDVIVSIDRVPAAWMSLEEAGLRLRGVPGTPVELRVRRDGREFTATLARRRLSSPNSFSRMAAPGVGYVYFAAFSEGADQELFGHIRRLKASGAASLILDVRGNPGGLLPMAQSIASEFLRDGQEIDTIRAQGLVIERAVVDGDGEFKDMPTAVLIDSGSASASELLAAALQDHARALVVGWRSYGKGTFQAVVPTEIPVERDGAAAGRAPDGTGVKVTGGGWFAPSGRTVQGRHDPATGSNVPGSGGVRPDVTVPVSDSEQEAVMEGIIDELFRSGPAAPRDPALEKALELLAGQSA